MTNMLPGPVVVDIAGTVLTENEAQRLSHPLVGGVILFARNYHSRDQLLALTQQIRQARPGPLFISVDHEGGRVQRFREDGFTQLPAMRRIGAYYDQDPMRALGLATDVAYILASELRACGVDLSYAPVLDLDYDHNQVIGERALHACPKAVTQLARALIQGLSMAGMKAVGKHFPGHGYVSGDSHLQTPVDTRSLDEILGADSMPYEWLGEDVLPAVMPAHIIYPAVDPEHTAGFSKMWIQEILRRRLGYQGLLFSDDLTMEGAAYIGGIVARAQAALSAGVDMVLVCNRPDLADELLRGLDQLPSELLNKKVERLYPSTPSLDWDQLQQDSHYQRAQARLKQFNNDV